MAFTLATFQALKKGNHEAFHEVFVHFRGLLYVVILSIIHHETTAEDVLQDTFIKIYQKAHTVKAMEHFQAWAVMVAKRTALNALKKRQEEAWQEAYDDIIPSHEPKHMFQTWHANLSEEENLIIAYKIVYDLGFKTIAQLLNQTINEVYQTYQKALKKIKETYQR